MVNATIGSNVRLSDLQKATRLHHEFTSVYRVDVVNNSYVELSSTGPYRYLGIEPEGEDFFLATRENVAKVIYHEDLNLLTTVMNKRALLGEVADCGAYSVKYRILIDGEPTYAQLLAMMGNDNRYIIVTVSDINDYVRLEEHARQAEGLSKVYGDIARSLASQYATIYFVDVYTKSYIEFDSSSLYKDLGVPQEGDDFFAESRVNIMGVIHPDDVDSVSAIMDRDRMTDAVSRDGTLSIQYRLKLGEHYSWARMNVAWADDRRHLIVGVADIDDEMKRELARKELEERGRIYGYIAQSLANQYATIYYVDVYTEHYTEFASSDVYKNLNVAPAGDDFFRTSRKNILRVIHPNDVEMVLELMDRDYMTQAINEHGSVSITYRLMLDGREAYTNLRAVWADDMRHLIIGVADVDTTYRRELEQKAAEERSTTYSHIVQSLANRYFTIYYVDSITNSYTEYGTNDEYSELNIADGGADFFAAMEINVLRIVHVDDRDLVLSLMSKEGLLQNLTEADSVTASYRLMLNGEARFVSLRVVWAEDKRHLIIGLSDIDDEVRREREHARSLHLARERALHDEMTGVKNKAAYVEMGAALQEGIENGEVEPFGIVVCDINGLKAVNDNLGHKAGDDYIREACSQICQTFAHSPVFRIGGDEFVVVIQGDDYERRAELLEVIQSHARESFGTEKPNAASGMSVYRPGEDAFFEEVFARADERMYEDKRALKGL